MKKKKYGVDFYDPTNSGHIYTGEVTLAHARRIARDGTRSASDLSPQKSHATVYAIGDDGLRGETVARYFNGKTYEMKKKKLSDRQQYTAHLENERERRRLSSLALDEEREKQVAHWLSESERDARNEEDYKSWKK